METKYSLFVLIITIIGVLQGTTIISFSSTHYLQQIPATLPNGFRYTGNLPSGQEVTFTVFIPLKNVDEIFYYAEATSNPSSPLYHKFLTRDQIKQFLPTEKYEEVLNYLKANNFSVLLTALNSVIVAKGTVEQIQNALGISFSVYSNGTLTFYISQGESKIPGITIIAQNLTAAYLSHPPFLTTAKQIEEFYQNVVSGSPNVTEPIEAYWPTALQKVYNATSLYKIGDEGQGYNIGILDFFGDPYIFQQLAYFDKITGLPDTNFTVVPIGSYNPNLGIITDWAGEISLDVEVAHAMAPRANITLYIASGDTLLPTAIAYIDQENKVDVLSQSFGIPESLISQFPSQFFYTCIYEADVYYALGSAEGITFLASSGDAGGAGYSNGPVGAVIYPSTSPFVTAVGGTTTYIQFPGSYVETAWSNYGFVPNNVNFGGSTGGISILEPKPWYEWNILTPATYPAGNEVPQVSANANVYPGVYIIGPYNDTEITGGTSEASPLIAGLLTLAMKYTHSRLGLINPVLFYFGENTTLYPKVFHPITFGYIIPWTASYGYNLVTGWGSLDIGNFAYYYNKTASEKKISIEVNVVNSTGETPQQFYPGQSIEVLANITYNGSEVTSGEFNAVISSVFGNITTASLTYNPELKEWVANITLPDNANGILIVNVYGKYNATEGYGFTEIFSGYYVTFTSPATFVPTIGGYINATVADSFGQIADIPVLKMTIYYYNISDNEYVPIKNVTAKMRIVPIEVDGFTYNLTVWLARMPSLPAGVYLIVVNNAFGYVAFTYGISLQGQYPYGIYILPQVLAEPGVVYPGQSIIIRGLPYPPSLVGINITAKLVNPEGKVISEAQIPFSTALNRYFGYLSVPTNATPGLYTVLLSASYDLGGFYINGSFFGQIYVGKEAKINVKPITYAFQGQTLQIYANITYSNGTEVKYGMFSAVVYPQSLSSIVYTSTIQSIQIPLWYNANLGLWYGNVTLPSTYSPGNLTYLQYSAYFGQPFQILITGETHDGYVTTTSLSAASTFYVLPYTLLQGKTITDPQTYDTALINDNIILNGTLINDVLINDTIYGNIVISNSNITNITIINSNITIISSQVYGLKAVNSKITVIDSKVTNVNLKNSQIYPYISTITNINPPLPIINLVSPINLNNLTGVVQIEFNVIGQDIKQVELLLNGIPITTFNTNGTLTYSLNTTSYPDGTYLLEIMAIQNDNLQSNLTTHVTFHNNLVKLSSNQVSLNKTINVISSSLSSSISSINKTISSEDSRLSNTNTISYVDLALAIIAIVIGIAALILRRR